MRQGAKATVSRARSTAQPAQFRRRVHGWALASVRGQSITPRPRKAGVVTKPGHRPLISTMRARSTPKPASLRAVLNCSVVSSDGGWSSFMRSPALCGQVARLTGADRHGSPLIGNGRRASSAVSRASASAMSSRKPASVRGSFANRRIVRIRMMRCRSQVSSSSRSVGTKRAYHTTKRVRIVAVDFLRVAGRLNHAGPSRGWPDLDPMDHRKFDWETR
jgi:hypothetical protein